jgi:surface protein
MFFNLTKHIKKLAASLLSLSPIIIAQNPTCSNGRQIYNECCKKCGYSFTTTDELQRAFTEFRSDGSTAENKYGIMNCWDVNKITDMSNIFYNINGEKSEDSINEPINCWNVSRVTNMISMFLGATSFNQPLDMWDVSSVTNMHDMFNGATSFNQPLDMWDVSSVTSMNAMFNGASSFNQPLNSWDVRNVTNMQAIFYDGTSFNQPLDMWDVSSVTNMRYMFYNARSFNQPLDNWNVSNVHWMTEMFKYSEGFSQNLCKWFYMPYKTIPDVKEMFFRSSCTNTSDPNFDLNISFCGTTKYPTCHGIVSCNSGRCYSLFLILKHVQYRRTQQFRLILVTDFLFAFYHLLPVHLN